ncbi:UNVERIFIED_CONTAM: hypothetical protein Sindi_2289100 [Sesamum indicum]
MEKHGGSICPNILKKINKQQHAARNCFIRWYGGGEYEIDHFLNNKCLQIGHNKDSCKNEIHPESKFFKKKSHMDLKPPPPLSQEQPSKKATSKGKRKSSNVVQPHALAPDFATQVGYQGPRNASLLGNDIPTASSIPATRRYNKRPTISKVLDKMKERQKRRQQE